MAECRHVLGRPDLGFPLSAEKCSEKTPDGLSTFFMGSADQVLDLAGREIGEGVAAGGCHSGGCHLSIPHRNIALRRELRCQNRAGKRCYLSSELRETKA